MDVGAIVLLAYVLLKVDYWRPRTREDVIRIVVSGLLLLFAGTGLIYLGLQSTTSGVGAIILSLSPVITVALAAVLLPSERLSRVGRVGVLVAFVGVGFVVQPNPNDFLSGNLKGEEFLLLGATAVGFGNVLLRRSNATISPVALTAWALVIAAPAMHLLSFGIGERPSMIDPTVVALFSVLYLGIFEMAIAISLYFLLIGDIGASRTSFVQYTIPIITLITGWLVLGEQLTGEALVGFLIIFVGFLLLNYDDVLQMSRRLRTRVAAGG